MGSKFRVFVVDDDPLILELLREILVDDYELEVFSSGEKCLARLGELKPNLFLVDVMMPSMDGYTLCCRLKADWDTEEIPVVFMSANDDMDTRLLCYNAGGEDFIVKPFQAVEVHRKLKSAQRIFSEKHALHEQAGYAQRTAMSAMISMGELGIVLQFLSKSFACDTMSEVAVAILAAMQQWDLRAAVQLRIGETVQTISHNGTDLPLEVSVLNHVRNSGRIFQLKSRCVFNYGHVTLMINNMPVEDVERCGRIRDNAALLAEGADARLKAIAIELVAQQRRTVIEAALPRVHVTLDAVQANYRRNCYELTQVMIEFQEGLIKSFVHMGLSEDQEDLLSTMAVDYMQRMVGTQDESLVTVGQLEELARSLEGLIKR